LGVLNFSVVSNTDEILTLNPDPWAAGVAVGDALIMRSVPTVGSDVDGNYIEDAKWANILAGDGTGFNEDEEIGRLLRIIAGTAAGTGPYRIKANTATRVYVDGEWATTPDETSIYIIEDPEWQVATTTEALNNADSDADLQLFIEIENYLQKTVLVQVVTVDGGDNESIAPLCPIRETYIYGDSGEAGLAKAIFGIDGETEIGTDLGPRHLVRTNGVPHWVSVNASSVTVNLIQDIQYSADGVAWESIFDDGNENKVNLPAGTTEQLTFTGFKAGVEFAKGGLLRRDVIAGKAEDVELVLEYGAGAGIYGQEAAADFSEPAKTGGILVTL